MKAKGIAFTNIIVNGDLNARCKAWCPNDKTDDAGEVLHQLFSAVNLPQIVSAPTNIYGGAMKSCIDLVVTDIEEATVTTLPPVGNSDHASLYVSISHPLI